MKGHGAKFPRKRETAIAALIEHKTVAEAAAATGVTERTLRRWQKDAGFAADYRQARLRIVAEALARVQNGSSRAVETLEELRDDPRHPAIRHRAACSLLDRACVAAENDEIEQRVAKLERQLEQMK